MSASADGVVRADRWRPTAAHVRALLAGAVLALVAVLARRPDAAVVATPLVTIAAWSLARRPTVAPAARQRIGHRALFEGQTTTWHIEITDDEGYVEDVAARLDVSRHVDLDPPPGEVTASLHDDGIDALAMGVRPTRWGRRSIGPAMVLAHGAWGAFRSVSRHDADARSIVVLPQPSTFDATAPPVRTPGLVGVNRSPRQGSGAEFASIRPFQPGDRLRRIHWPQSLRTGTLHVTSTWADHDRHVVLMIDALDDVGDSEGVDGKASSLDIAMRAGSAIAEHYIESGDRVALVAFGARGVQRVPPATGRRHLRRLLEVMATTEPAAHRTDTGQVPRGLGAGALVILLSPLITPKALQRAVTMVDHGLTVLVIDCLPPDIVAEDPTDPYVSVLWRIRALEREREIRHVRETGVAVVPWRGPGTLDVALRNLQRQSRARVVRRA